MSLITKVSLFVEPLPTFFLDEHTFLSTVDVSAPITLIESADEALDLNGELISYVNRNPMLTKRKIKLMANEARKGFFDNESLSSQWATFFASTPTGLRYSILVEFDEVELMYRNFQRNTGLCKEDLKRLANSQISKTNAENEGTFRERDQDQTSCQDVSLSAEIAKLVERVSSAKLFSDDSEEAWVELEGLPHRETAIEPLMKAFRHGSGLNRSTRLCKFLGNLRSDHARNPLFEIVDYSRHSSDRWDQKYLLGSACNNLLKLPGGVSTLRNSEHSELFRFILARALMSAKDEERTQIVELVTEDERQDIVIELISVFRSVEDKDEWASNVSDALSSLGDSAIEPLLEIFRTVKDSKIEDDGSIQVDGEDGPPASALIRIPGGIEKLKSLCPPGEYERILVRSHDYGDSSNPELNRALGDIATRKAIGRLRFVLQQSSWSTETRKPAKEALVNVGNKAHAELLRALGENWSDRKFQTFLRKEILDVLKETGDEDCLLRIRTAMADPLVAEEARAAIQAISQRCANIEVPDTGQPKPLPLRTIARTGDVYVDSCFQIESQEFYDERNWFEIPEVKAIPRAETTEEALRLAEALREKYPDFYFSYYWFNILYRRQKRYEDARNAVIEGLRAAKAKSSLCERMGDTEWEVGNLSEAVKWWIRSIVIQTGSGNLDDYASFLHLSYVAEQLGLFDASVRLRKYVDLIRAGQIRVTDELATELFTATRNQGTESMARAISLLDTTYLKAKGSYFDEFLSLVMQSFCTSPEAVQSALSLVLQHKGLRTEAEAEARQIQRDLVLSDKYPEVTFKLRALSILRAKIAQKTLASAGKEGVHAHRLFLAKWHAQKEQLEAEIAREVREIDVERKLRSIDYQVVAMAMPEGATLIEFARFDTFDFKAVPARGEKQWKPARYVAFVLPARKPDAVEMIDLGEAEPIDKMIATFRSIITGEEHSSSRGLGALPSLAGVITREDVGIRLREAVFTPLLKAIDNCTRLMISPDGELTKLPLEVLPTDDGRRLIDEYTISYLAAGRDVVRFDFKSNRKPGKSLVVADPDFDLDLNVVNTETAARAGRVSRDFKREATETFERLPGTRLEGEQIAAMLDAELWTDNRALDSALKKCQSPRILHLSTHGFFLEDQKRDPKNDRLGFGVSLGESGMDRLVGSHLENPLLRSGLALAGVNSWLEKGELMEEAEDGLITAEDVSGLDLLDTELVVLSACETGLGEVRIGEGVFGLRRAFVLAGAKTLVMSLWKVPDEQTRQLMEDFYRRILAGQSRANALREAQLAMKAKHPDPLYWGAFICQGDPNPITICAEI